MKICIIQVFEHMILLESRHSYCVSAKHSNTRRESEELLNIAHKSSENNKADRSKSRAALLCAKPLRMRSRPSHIK